MGCLNWGRKTGERRARLAVLDHSVALKNTTSSLGSGRTTLAFTTPTTLNKVRTCTGPATLPDVCVGVTLQSSWVGVVPAPCPRRKGREPAATQTPMRERRISEPGKEREVKSFLKKKAVIKPYYASNAKKRGKAIFFFARRPPPSQSDTLLRATEETAYRGGDGAAFREPAAARRPAGCHGSGRFWLRAVSLIGLAKFWRITWFCTMDIVARKAFTLPVHFVGGKLCPKVTRRQRALGSTRATDGYNERRPN